MFPLLHLMGNYCYSGHIVGFASVCQSSSIFPQIRDLLLYLRMSSSDFSKITPDLQQCESWIWFHRLVDLNLLPQKSVAKPPSIQMRVELGPLCGGFNLEPSVYLGLVIAQVPWWPVWFWTVNSSDRPFTLTLFNSIIKRCTKKNPLLWKTYGNIFLQSLTRIRLHNSATTWNLKCSTQFLLRWMLFYVKAALCNLRGSCKPCAPSIMSWTIVFTGSSHGTQQYWYVQQYVFTGLGP